MACEDTEEGSIGRETGQQRVFLEPSSSSSLEIVPKLHALRRSTNDSGQLGDQDRLEGG